MANKITLFFVGVCFPGTKKSLGTVKHSLSSSPLEINFNDDVDDDDQWQWILLDTKRRILNK